MPFIPKECNTMTKQDQTNHIETQRGQAAIYTRVAPSTRTQIAKLIALANDQGYPNERIIVYEDVYVSRRKRLAKHSAFSDILTAITQDAPVLEQEPIRAIYVSSENRLFRDQDAVDL